MSSFLSKEATLDNISKRYPENSLKLFTKDFETLRCPFFFPPHTFSLGDLQAPIVPPSACHLCSQLCTTASFLSCTVEPPVYLVHGSPSLDVPSLFNCPCPKWNLFLTPAVASPTSLPLYDGSIHAVTHI
jgi:hypothetical protein